jgi:hypothetical protein
MQRIAFHQLPLWIGIALLFVRASRVPRNATPLGTDSAEKASQP